MTLVFSSVRFMSRPCGCQWNAIQKLAILQAESSSFINAAAVKPQKTLLINNLSPLQNQIRGLASSKDIDKKVDDYRKGNFETIPDPTNLTHFRTTQSQDSNKKERSKEEDNASLLKEAPPIGKYVLPHPIWTEKELNEVTITHKEPKGFVDHMAFGSVKLLRGAFDLFSGFLFGERNEKKWLNRISFLETVAGVPGMVAAMLRHMRSLRRMQRDQNWIHTLLEEAENERMHLLTALQLKQPSLLFRMCVIGAQGVFVTAFGMIYIVSPRFCHRFVGYLEEEAVVTYTKCLQDIDNGPMKHWQTQAAPDMAKLYWKLEMASGILISSLIGDRRSSDVLCIAKHAKNISVDQKRVGLLDCHPGRIEIPTKWTVLT